MMAENYFTEAGFLLPEQKSVDGIVFPAVLFPNPNNYTRDVPLTLSGLTEAIQSHNPWLQSLLHQSGAILFRGFPVSSPSDFNDVVEAFGFDDFPYIGGGAPRSKVVGRVLTANESPPDQKIPFHHEMSHARDFPSKLFFFCDVEPGSGGETPVVLSHVIYKRMKEKHPQFIEHLEEHGLIYAIVMGDEDDPTAPVGRGWKSTFNAKDRSEAEKRAGELGMTLEWMEDGVRVKMGPMPGIKLDVARQRKIWFNSVAVTYEGLKDTRNEDPAKSVMFGDGKQLPTHVMYDCLKIMEEECVAIPWQKDDLLLVDNLAVLHSRRTLITPPRRILASLCK